MKRLVLLVLAVGLGFWAQAQTDAQLQIQPPWVPDELLIGLVDDQMPGPPRTGKTPDDLYAAAGLTVLSDQELTPPEVVEHRVHVRLSPGSKFGRTFQIIQTFDFGAGSRWSLQYVEPNGLGWAAVFPGPLHSRRVFNLSARADVGVGEKVTIGGLIVPGDYARLVVFKARGASLATLGVVEPLADPRLQLHDRNGVILENDDWETLADWELELALRVCPPPGDRREAMIVTYVDPGAYTAIVSGAESGSGIALLEMYLLDQFLVQ